MLFEAIVGLLLLPAVHNFANSVLLADVYFKLISFSELSTVKYVQGTLITGNADCQSQWETPILAHHSHHSLTDFDKI